MSRTPITLVIAFLLVLAGPLSPAIYTAPNGAGDFRPDYSCARLAGESVNRWLAQALERVVAG